MGIPAAGSVTYGAPGVTYTAEPVGTMTYSAPAATTYAAPSGGAPVYTISPERFQRIMAGEPLTQEEIAAMTAGAGASAALQTGSAVLPGASAAIPGAATASMVAVEPLANTDTQ